MRRIERTHTIELPLPIARAFPLFTPKGEMEWIEDWRPSFLYPEDGETSAGMVFTTGENQETLWSCIEWAPEQHRVRYARVTPGSRFGFVQVACSALSADATRVHVSYEFTALTPEGETFLDAVTPEAFAASIDGWKQLIQTHIIKA